MGFLNKYIIKKIIKSMGFVSNEEELKEIVKENKRDYKDYIFYTIIGLTVAYIFFKGRSEIKNF